MMSGKDGPADPMTPADEGGRLPGSDAKPFAVCAPGNRFLAELVLALHGEQVSEVRESRFLEGMSGVYVITPPDFGKLAPPFEFTRPPSMADVLRNRALAAAFMPPPLPIAALSSIA
jgi:hypothetical protein